MKKKILICVLCIFTMAVMTVPTFAYSDEVFYTGELNIVSEQRGYDYIDYTSKSEEEFNIVGRVPNYYNNNNALTNCCACVAGAIGIGYYDFWYPNLVPDYNTYVIVRGQKAYKGMAASDGARLQELINDMYNVMGTNSISPGTNENQFFNGLTSYVTSKGYTFSKTSVATFGNISVSSLDTQLRAGKPVTILCSTFNLLNTFYDENNRTTLGKVVYNTAHIMVVYGYKRVKYYNGSNNFRTNLYLRVASGIGSDISSGYILATDSTFDLNNAYAISVS